MKNFTTLIVVLFLSVSSLRAEQIFVLFDGTCGDRVKYEQAIARQPRMDYFAYHFAFQGGDRLMLETGAEGATVQNFLPQGYLYCGDPRLNLELANRVNGGVDRVFVLLPTANNQYIIQPVVMASVLQRRGASFSYFSPLSGYEFDTENGIIGENLAVNNEGAKVYFEGRETSPCAGYFLFRQLKPGASYPVIDYKISPEIGIFERRLGSDGISTSGGTIIAREVNGIPVANHLAGVCTGTTALTNNTGQVPGPAPTVPAAQPGAYGTQPTVPSYTAPQPESQAYGQQAPQPTTSITHTVAKGETLFGVSRKYGTTVDAIKAQNGLTSNTLFPGQQLSLTTTTSPQAPGVGEAVVMAPTVPTVPYNAGPVATSNPGAAQPTPYGGSPAAPEAYGQPAQTPRSSQAAVYGEDVHMVQPGETVASIALRYGYTSAKFREINDMGSNEIVKVGQQLKTSDCNCPAPAPVVPQEVAPDAYGQQNTATPQPYGQPSTPQYGQPAAPQAYGQQAPATPQAYGQPAATPQYGQPATPQAYGNQQPAATATPAYRTPAGYQAPQASPVPAQTTPAASQRLRSGEYFPEPTGSPRQYRSRSDAGQSGYL